MKSNCVQSFMQMVASQTSGEAGTKPSHTLAMAQPCQRQASALLGHTRTSIRPQAILEVVR